MIIDWEKMGNFVQSVGVPSAILFSLIAPFGYLLYGFLRKYGATIAESHIKFMDSAAITQEKNADTLARLETTVAQKHADHTVTHQAIGLVAQAGISILDNDHKSARTKLERVEHVLTRKDESR
jgi:hypothetical protein